MKCTISTPGQHVVLTLTVDLSINTPNLSRTDLILDRVVSSPISILILDLRSLSCVNSFGTWTILQIVFKAREQGKGVFLYNVQPSIQPYLKEAGILELSTTIDTQEELGNVLEGNYRLPRSCANGGNVKTSFQESQVPSAGIASL
ncbi:STAS domain-containing protein [Candidatus Nitrospira allomarina]|uniref:STAS domain-containing protein n=1 Tax=Candidatus Nitrospira allomarina TaxID=3020900 RepID=A0AA96JQP6_9BACT|nr:STAS domain-containing protein [Candidatus Nitrospira allomarina]WNM56667.1 STAS domain-containing protein [Candidatus Nitrospira allomarina]